MGEVGADMFEVTDRRLVRTGVRVGYAEGGADALLLIEPDREGDRGVEVSSSGTAANPVPSLGFDEVSPPRPFPSVDSLQDRCIKASAVDNGLSSCEAGSSGDEWFSGVVTVVKSEDAASEPA